MAVGALKRVVVVLALGSFLLAGCENPDFSDVRFRPPRVDPSAFKSAMKGYVFLRRKREVTWGNEFLYHTGSLPEREFQPLVGLQVLIDETIPLTTDETGLMAIDGMKDGYHTARFRHDGKAHVTHFRVRREQVTLIVMELRSRGRLNTSTTQVPHSFLTVQPFQRLLAFHLGCEKVLGIYESARQGKATDRWEKLLADDYADGRGAKEDFLRALRLRSGQDPDLAVLGRQGDLGDKNAAVVVQLEHRGNPDFVKLELKTVKDGGWRIASIQE